MVAQAVDPQRLEALGPAEQIVQTLTTWSDHLVHNRPGIVVEDRRTRVGVRWDPVTWKQEDDGKVVYRLSQAGGKKTQTRIGVMEADGTVQANGRVVGEYRKPAAFPVFPEVATYLYRQVAEVWKLDNDFAAHWASWTFPRDHKDAKVVLAAFMLVQNRSGEPVKEGDEVLFHDEDHRAIGEAMCLLRRKDRKDMSPKLLLRVGHVLKVPGVAEVNRELGFGLSARNPAMGRYPKVVSKWLKHREDNPKILEGLVRAGFRKTVLELCRMVGYKPSSQKFFEILRWKQKQAEDGRRELAIGLEMADPESWEGLDEAAICQRIVKDKPSWKRIIGLLPPKVGMTRAIVAAAVESNCLSDADLVILTPTFEDLGLLEVPVVRNRWKAALEKAENQRAANIAKRVRKADVKQELEKASDEATKKAIEEVTKDLRVYVVVDKSGSMDGAIDKAKAYLKKFLGGFKLDRLHVSIFNSVGRELKIAHASSAGVEQAFRGHTAGGGTSYAQGFKAVSKHKPKDGEDALVIFVGDQSDYNHRGLLAEVQYSRLNPVAFGLLEVIGSWGERGNIVQSVADELQIPCFRIEEDLFDDPYAITRTLRNLIANTPVGARAAGAPRPRRKQLVEEILETELLTKPVWA